MLIPSLAVAGSGLLWGVWWIPLRWLEASGLSGDWASVALYAAAVAVLVPVVLLRPGPIRGGRSLVLIGLFTGVAFAAWNHALISGDVVRVTLLFYLAPIWGTGLGFLFYRDPLTPWRVLSIGLGLAGAAVVLGFEGGFPMPRNLAEWVALISGVLFAFGAVYARGAPAVPTLDKTLANAALAGLASLGFAVALPVGTPVSFSFDSTLPLIACVTWLIPTSWLLLWGATRLDAGRVGILLLLEVLAAAFSAALLTDEPFGWREGLGCLLIIGAGLAEAGDEMRARRVGAAI